MKFPKGKIVLTILVICGMLSVVSCADKKTSHSQNSSLHYSTDRDAFGRFVARESQLLYYIDSSQCDETAYNCSGIMISGFESNSDYWMKPYPMQDKISLSFWRVETTGKTATKAAFVGDGFMLWPNKLANDLSDGNLFNARFKCAFAMDGGTGGGGGFQCGGYSTPHKICQDLGVYTESEFIDMFGIDGLNDCGFALGASEKEDKDAFNAVFKLQQDYGVSFNEVLIKGWDSDESEKIPLLGFFYISEHSGLKPEGSLSRVMERQYGFYEKTKIFAPIIRISGADWAHARFEYDERLQSPEIPQNVDVNVDVNK